MHVNGNNRKVSYDAIYFDIFVVEHTQKEIKKFIGNKNIIANIYRIEAYNSAMCGYFCIWLIDFMLKGKSFLNNTNLFSPKDYEKNDKVIVINFQYLKRWKSYIVLFAVSIKNLKNLKYRTLGRNISSFYYLQ